MYKQNNFATSLKSLFTKRSRYLLVASLSMLVIGALVFKDAGKYVGALNSVPANDISLIGTTDEYTTFDLDNYGDVVLANSTDSTIEKYSSTGILAYSTADYDDYYSNVEDIAVGTDGSVYLLRNTRNPSFYNEIIKLNSSLEYVDSYNTNLAQTRSSPMGMDVDSNGNVYFSNSTSSVNSILKLSSDFGTLSTIIDGMDEPALDVHVSSDDQLYLLALDVNDEIVIKTCAVTNCSHPSSFPYGPSRTYATELTTDSRDIAYVSSLFTGVDVISYSDGLIEEHSEDWGTYYQDISYYESYIFVMVSEYGVGTNIYAFDETTGVSPTPTDIPYCSEMYSCDSGTVYELEGGMYFSDDPDCSEAFWCDTYPVDSPGMCGDNDGCDCYWEEGVECLNEGGGPTDTATPTATPTPTPGFSDNFDEAVNYVGGSGNYLYAELLVNATLEQDEDSSVLDKYNIEGSLWAKYTATQDGDVEFNTCNSYGPYSTNTGGLTMQIYTGTALNDLTFVGGNKNGCYENSYGSRINFYAEEGETYYIQIGINEVSEIENSHLYYDNYLRINPYSSSVTPPANDGFADAETIEPNLLSSSDDYQAYEKVVWAATMEPSEPDYDKYLNSARSIWYTWTSGNTAEEMWLDTCEKGYGFTYMDSVISVYTGSAVNDLTLVAENDDWDNPRNLDWGCGWSGETSMLKFTTTPNTTYYFRVLMLSNIHDNFLEKSLFTFRNKPTIIPVEPIEDIPLGNTVCDNHGGVARAIPYAMSDGGLSLDAWNECFSWCNANMSDDYPTCQFNGDGPRNCWLNYPPLVSEDPDVYDIDQCIWKEGSVNYGGNLFPMGAYVGQTSGYLLKVPEEIDAKLKNSPNIDVTKKRQKGEKTVMIEEKADIAPLADVAVAFEEGSATNGKLIEWNTLTADSNPNFGKAFIHGLTDQAGASSSFDLYIPIPSGNISNSVYVCPGADSLGDVTQGCTDGVEYEVGDSVPGTSDLVRKENVKGAEYWVIPGQTGTGGQALVTDFDLKDIMTRLEVSELSNHEIYFGTGNTMDTSGDTIVVTFGTAWNFGSLAITDLAFFDAGAPLTLAATPGDGVWGAVINSMANTITLTAPTEGSGYILSEHILKLEINNEVLQNPATVGSYPIEIVITTDGTNTEDGTITVPIVDSDQVMITGYVDTFISFDIDTGYTADDLINRLDCNYDSCLQFNGGGQMANYTVDFGELTSTSVNISRESSNHNGVSGEINSIYFDLTSNAIGGVIVTVSSLYDGLQGPNTNLIPGVANDGDNITVNSGRYGYSVRTSVANSGTIVRNSNCDIVDAYCAPTSSGKLVFNTNGKPADSARVRMDLAAAAKYTNNPGVYEDTLTFRAVATY